jgi:sortase (surface protein transpeptidase)
MIPSVGIDAAVEQVGLADDGSMATPQDPWHTGWYAPGTRPGQPGNAAIDGHVDYHGIGEVVFWNLRQVQPGAAVLVVTSDNQTLRFIVQGVARYSPDNAPLASIFGPANTPNLNLITCDGTFNPETRHYDLRFVVYTTYAGKQ